MRTFQAGFDKEEVDFITVDLMLDRADKIKEGFWVLMAKVKTSFFCKTAAPSLPSGKGNALPVKNGIPW